MSLVLTDAGEKLEITAAVVIPFTVHYADYVGATPVFTPRVVGDDTIVGTMDLLAAPASGQRVVRTISVFNDSGGADTITIQLDDGGVNYTIMTVTLPDDYALCYDEDGWKVLDDNGALVTVLPTHAVLGPHHSDAATDAVTRGSLIYGNATPQWDELVHPGAIYHLQTDANDVVWAQNITMVDDAWIGIGAALERIIFDAAGDITVMGANFGVGTLTPGEAIGVEGHITLKSEGWYKMGDATSAANVTGVGHVAGVGMYFDVYKLAGGGTLGADSMDAMVIRQSTGNVGIGTTGPNQKLTIEGTMSLKEQAAANADTATYGQLWVKNTTPCQLWFTDDTGTDTQIV